MVAPSRVGVLALQGDVALHVAALRAADVDPVEVRTPAELASVDALVLPGGESTTMSMLLDSSGLRDPLTERLGGAMPVFGTCAGMILLAAEVSDGRADQRSFAALDIGVRRNGHGRQLRSFEAELDVDVVGSPPVKVAFIRAPVIERTGPDVEVLASVEGPDGQVTPALVRSGRILASTFHPELFGDQRIHAWFLAEVAGGD